MSARLEDSKTQEIGEAISLASYFELIMFKLVDNLNMAVAKSVNLVGLMASLRKMLKIDQIVINFSWFIASSIPCAAAFLNQC